MNNCSQITTFITNFDQIFNADYPCCKCNCKNIVSIYPIVAQFKRTVQISYNKQILLEKFRILIANYLLYNLFTDFIKMRREGLDEFVRKILGLPNTFNQ